MNKERSANAIVQLGMVLTVYLNLPMRFIVLISKYNGVFYGCVSVMNHIFFAHTRLVPVIATIVKHAYLVLGGHRDDVSGSSRLRLFHCISVCLTIFNIIHCCQGLTCSTEHPFLI